MAKLKTLNTKTAAEFMTSIAPCVLDFDGAANAKQPEPSVKTPLPAPLAKALGQSS
jgi:hypothetical protein